jgi:hypothetical protein
LTLLDVSEPQVAVKAYVPAVSMCWPHDTVAVPPPLSVMGSFLGVGVGAGAPEENVR